MSGMCLSRFSEGALLEERVRFGGAEGIVVRDERVHAIDGDELLG